MVWSLLGHYKLENTAERYDMVIKYNGLKWLNNVVCAILPKVRISNADNSSPVSGTSGEIPAGRSSLVVKDGFLFCTTGKKASNTDK